MSATGEESTIAVEGAASFDWREGRLRAPFALQEPLTRLHRECYRPERPYQETRWLLGCGELLGLPLVELMRRRWVNVRFRPVTVEFVDGISEEFPRGNGEGP